MRIFKCDVGDIILNLEFVVGILLPPAVKQEIGCVSSWHKQNCGSDLFLKRINFGFPNANHRITSSLCFLP